jgi:four helix bundle protein
MARPVLCVTAMPPEQLKARAFDAAVRTIRFVESLPRGMRTWTVGRQLMDSGTSQAAQYRAASRAQSRRDFISKMKRMEEEADESALWLGLLRATGLPQALAIEAAKLEAEFCELTAIAVASVKTARKKL